MSFHFSFGVFGPLWIEELQFVRTKDSFMTRVSLLRPENTML